jgi:hypothetical protein
MTPADKLRQALEKKRDELAMSICPNVGQRRGTLEYACKVGANPFLADVLELLASLRKISEDFVPANSKEYALAISEMRDCAGAALERINKKYGVQE